MIFRKLFDMYAAYFMINGNFWLLHELELSSVDKPDVDSRDRAGGSELCLNGRYCWATAELYLGSA